MRSSREQTHPVVPVLDAVGSPVLYNPAKSAAVEHAARRKHQLHRVWTQEGLKFGQKSEQLEHQHSPPARRVEALQVINVRRDVRDVVTLVDNLVTRAVQRQVSRDDCPFDFHLVQHGMLNVVRIGPIRKHLHNVSQQEKAEVAVYVSLYLVSGSSCSGAYASTAKIRYSGTPGCRSQGSHSSAITGGAPLLYALCRSCP